MGWKDREYNGGREEMKAYLSNPGALLQYALPLYRSRTLSIRLSFWFLLAALFLAINDAQVRLPLYTIPCDIAVMLLLVLWHELGHRFFSRMVGGNHWEWVLWPAGGMVPPTVPRQPWPTFVASIGGLVFNGALLLLIYGLLNLTPIASIFVGKPALTSLVLHIAGTATIQSLWIVGLNLFPCYWFDGGFIWQSILWPKLGLWKAIRITCLAGMILAAPLLVFALLARSLMGMIFAALIFADCFRRRQMLAAAGEGVLDEDEGAPAYNYMDSPEPRRRKKRGKRWFRSARKRATRDQAEQAKIDSILAKVKEKGLHSLTWWEKRTLKKATERQRQQDLAQRL